MPEHLFLEVLHSLDILTLNRFFFFFFQLVVIDERGHCDSHAEVIVSVLWQGHKEQDESPVILH